MSTHLQILAEGATALIKGFALSLLLLFLIFDTLWGSMRVKRAHRHIYFCWGGAGRVLSSCRPRFLFLQDGKACQKAFLNLPHFFDRRSFRATGDHIGLQLITFLFLTQW